MPAPLRRLFRLEAHGSPLDLGLLLVEASRERREELLVVRNVTGRELSALVYSEESFSVCEHLGQHGLLRVKVGDLEWLRSHQGRRHAWRRGGGRHHPLLLLLEGEFVQPGDRLLGILHARVENEHATHVVARPCILAKRLPR